MIHDERKEMILFKLFQVIDFAVCMMIHDERKEMLHLRNWFMPSTFTVNYLCKLILIWIKFASSH